MLGPAFAALVLSTMDCRVVTIEGDSSYVIGLLEKQFLTQDIFLYNCVEIIRDLFGNKTSYTARWIPRANNSVCDALAKQAVSSTQPSMVIYSDHFRSFAG